MKAKVNRKAWFLWKWHDFIVLAGIKWNRLCTEHERKKMFKINEQDGFSKAFDYFQDSRRAMDRRFQKINSHSRLAEHYFTKRFR